MQPDKSLKQKIWKLLDENPLYSPMVLCKLLDLNPHLFSKQVSARKSEWKVHSKNSGGLKALKSPLSSHAIEFFSYVPERLDRKKFSDVVSAALASGWVQSGKNRMLTFKRTGWGNIKWWETGRVILHLVKPVNRGRLKQLLAFAFSHGSLQIPLSIFEPWVESFKLHSEHIVYDTGEKVPYVHFDLLKDACGVEFVSGDRSHPTGYEWKICLPSWAEDSRITMQLNVEALKQFSNLIKDLSAPKPLDDKKDKSMVA
jgi:hypothetical protein